jgi:hypothetical protein
MNASSNGGSSEARRKKLLFPRPAPRLQGGRSDLRRLCGRAHLEALSEAELDQFEALLDAPDQDVYAWLRGAPVPPASYDTPSSPA